MAAPSATARQQPTGLKLINGHATFVTLANLPAIQLWETSVTPGGLEMESDGVDTTDMFNDDQVSMEPDALFKQTPAQFEASFDPAVYPIVRAQLGLKQVITITHPDGSTDAQWGWLQSFTRGAQVRGSQPRATCIINFSGTDLSQAEQAPVTVSVDGT